MKNKEKLVSFIIPVYNVEKYLRRCLNSLLNQTYTNWEAICVNDGSRDNSAEIIKEYSAKDSRFKLVDKENSGVSDSRNIGINLANGDYIFFVDSDDFIHPQTLEILTYFIEKKNADMVSFDLDIKSYRLMKKKINKKEDVSDFLPESRNHIYDVNKTKSYVTENILFHSTEKNRSLHVLHPVRRHCYPVLGLYRKNLVKKTSFIKDIIIEDFPWWSAVMLQRPKTVMIDLPLYFYMPNTASILNSSKALRMIESISVGIEYVYDLYSRYASYREFKHFNREFLWPFIIIAMRKTKDLDNKSDIEVARKAFKRIYNKGALNKIPNFRAFKYKRKIKNFIKEKL